MLRIHAKINTNVIVFNTSYPEILYILVTHFVFNPANLEHPGKALIFCVCLYYNSF